MSDRAASRSRLGSAAWWMLAAGLVAASTSAQPAAEFRVQGNAAVQAPAAAAVQARAVAPPWLAEPADPAPAVEAPAVPLVHTDEEFDEYLHQAAQHIERREHAEAIDVLQALIESGKPLFHRPQAGGRRYVSLRAAAADVLGRLPPEGLDLYRRMFDASAGRLMDEAARTGDAGLLARVAEEYLHTRHGPAALDRLGAIALDRADFGRAARAWEHAAEAAGPADARRAVRLAKAAVAWHLAGEEARAREAVAALARDHASAEAEFGGRRQNVAAFAAAALAAPPPAPRPRVGGEAWLSLAGAPDGLAAGPACDEAVFPLWRAPATLEDCGLLVQQVLGLAPASADGGNVATRRVPLRTDLRGGHVRVSSLWPAHHRTMVTVAPLLHPLVLDGLVVCREFDEVVAYDATTGRAAWRTSGLAMQRPLAIAGYGHPFAQWSATMGDAGRYTLTAGGGKVFTVCGFLPDGARVLLRLPHPLRADTAPPVDGSILAAVSVADQGKTLWKVGVGEGGSEVLREGKFLAAPTWADGRLFAVVLHLHTYHAVCLDAGTGAPVWETPVGQESAARPGDGPWGSVMSAYLLTERGSPPAVAGGRVFVTTNAGLVVALSAESGRPVWAYQYARGAVGEEAEGPAPSPERPLPPVNPVAVLGGRVIALPCDSPNVVALDADTGELAWESARRGQSDLTALDADRVLLSGPGLIVLGAKDGRVEREVPGVGPVLGRPAVAGGTVIASGVGELVRLDLATGSVTRRPVLGTEAVLGRLVAAGGRLVAANAAGVSAYFRYEDAWDRVGERLREARTAVERFDLHLARGQFALAARRLEEAEAEFRAAAELPAEMKDGRALSAVRPWLYRLGLVRAATADDAAAADRFLADAESRAVEPEQKAQVLLHRMRACERFGRFERAAECAQALADGFASVRLRDAGAAPEAILRPAEDRGRAAAGAALGQQHVARLIQEHGRGVYAAFDAAAREALARGRAEGDAERMLRAWERYPHSEWADDLLLASAEVFFGRAAGATHGRADLLDRAGRVLGEFQRHGAGPLAAQARAAAALVDVRRFGAPAGVLHAALRRDDPAARVDFGPFHGRVADVVAALDAAAASADPAAASPPACLAAPLREVYRLCDESVFILRGHDRTPVRLGPYVYLHREDRVLCLDTRINDFPAGTVWTAQATPGENLRRLGALTRDGRHVVSVDGGGLTAFEAASGKVVQRRSLNDLGLTTWADAAAWDDTLILADDQGRLTALRMPSLEPVWQAPGERTAGPLFLAAAGEVVLGRDLRGQVARVFDARTGRRLMSLAEGPDRPVDAALTDDGLVVTAQEGRVRLYDPQRPSVEPLWSVDLPGRRNAIIGLGGPYAAVTSPETRSIQVLDLTDNGRAVADVTPARLADRPFFTGRAFFEGKRMYLLCGSNMGGRGRGTLLEFVNLRSPTLHAIDLATGREAWSVSVAPGEGAYCNLEDPAFAGRHVALFSKPNDFREPATWFVLARETGETTASGTPAPEDLEDVDVNTFHVRRQMLGHPVLLNGRLLVEDEAGLILMRSPL